MNNHLNKDEPVKLCANITDEYLELKIKEALEYITNNKVIVYLEGLISGGKSSLCRSINRVLNKRKIRNTWYPEPIDGSLLDLFYSQPKKYAFSFQSIVIRDRIHVNEDAIFFLKDENGFVLIDRARFGDCAFGIMHYNNDNISNIEFVVYTNLIKSGRLDKYSQTLGLDEGKIKDFVVYLACTPEKSRERVIKRGNLLEIQNCTIDYLSELEINYNKVLGDEKTDALEQAAIDEVYRNYNNNILTFDYNDDLNIDAEGYIEEKQVLLILCQIVDQIKREVAMNDI